MALVIGAFFLKNKSETSGPRSLGGYCAFLVLTSSMEDTIPKDSFVLTKKVEANTLQIGDDITYLFTPITTVTHRIVEIREHDPATGERSFITQGTMNEFPDDQPIEPQNIVGKVIFHNHTLGRSMKWIGENWYILVTLGILFVGFYRSIRIAFDKTEENAR